MGIVGDDVVEAMGKIFKRKLRYMICKPEDDFSAVHVESEGERVKTFDDLLTVMEDIKD